VRAPGALVNERLKELEAFPDEVNRLADELIGIAASKAPYVGAWLHIDGTEAETHAVPRHDCQPVITVPRPGSAHPSGWNASIPQVPARPLFRALLGCLKQVAAGIGVGGVILIPSP
jgi:hypothetical protein